ncbi:hypothetical protein STANM309S_01473 [Streptomyces tanashiensis]
MPRRRPGSPGCRVRSTGSRGCPPRLSRPRLEEVAAAAGADLGETVARTLRGGLWEELRWPAWEEAVTPLAPARHTTEGLTVSEAWPYLIVANMAQVRVIDADSTVLVHDLRVPPNSARRMGFHCLDGALLVFWSTYGHGEPQGYWHTAPDTVFDIAGADHWTMRSDHPSLQLPGGGRTTGGGVLHSGDTKLPGSAPSRPTARRLGYGTTVTGRTRAAGSSTTR